jgi:hypothetical protein
MRKSKKLLAALAAAGLWACGASVHAAAPLTVHPTWDGYAWDDAPADGKGNAVYAGSPANDIAGVGELDHSSVKRMERSLFCFELPALPPGEKVERATLRLYLASLRDEGGKLPAARLHHNRPSTVATGYATYYENADFADTGLVVATAQTPPGTWVEVDVTKFVEQDYAEDVTTPRSWFRIQADGLEFADDNRSHRYVFKLSKGEHKPTLTITTAKGAKKNAPRAALPPLDKTPRHGLFALTNTSNWVIQDGKRLNLFDYDVSGVVNYTTWRMVEPAPGILRYPGLDAMLADAERTDKKLSYSILAGIHTPPWVYERAGIEKFVYHDRKREVGSFLPWKIVDGKRVLNTDMLAVWEKTVRAFSEHVYSLPARDRIFYVAITGFPFANGLEVMVGIDNHADFARLGWDREAEDLFIEYGKRVVDIFVELFPDVPLGISYADYYGTDANGQVRRSYRENDEIIGYALERGKIKGVTVVPMGLWLGWKGVMNETHPLIVQMRKFQKNSLAVALEGQMGTYKFSDCAPLDEQLDFALKFPAAWVHLWHHDVIHPDYQDSLGTWRPRFEHL